MSNKQQYVEQYKHFSLTHKGIRIDVVVDLQKKTVSLTDEYRGKKNYLFANRGLEYQIGRHNILEAMKLWMDEWYRILQEAQDTMTKEAIKLYHNLEGK